VKVFVYLILVSVAIVLCTSKARGQAATGSVIGTVYDQQGKVVPNAKVTVTNAGTQISKTTTTNQDGHFEVLDLPIGNYHVTVEREGFNKEVTQNQFLHINQSLRFDITLTVGSRSQTVTVEAKVAGVETVNQTIGGTVVGEAIQQAPLDGRLTLQLALLQPGVTESNADNTGAGNYSIAGGRTDSVTFVLDGALNNDLLDNSVVFQPNPETVAEFRVLESNYSAEYGRNGGGVITVVTKSGTNDWHGSAYDFLRNEDLDANSFFNKAQFNGQPLLPRNVLKRNQYGGTFGGPITIPHVVNGKNRFFFFAGYEGQRLTAAETASPFATAVVPTPAEVGCVGGGTTGCFFPDITKFLMANAFYQDPANPTPGFLNPAAINPVSAEYITKGLLPVSAAGEVTPNGPATMNYNQLTLKFDFLVSDKDKISVTLGGQITPTQDAVGTSANVGWANVPGFPISGKQKNYLLNSSYTRAFSPNLLNELRFFAQRNVGSQGTPVGPNAAFTPQALGFTNLTPDNPSGPPVLGFNTESTTVGYTIEGPSILVNNTFGVSDTVTWIRGRHTWKFGSGFSGYQNNQVFDFIVNGLYDFNGTLTGDAFADFLLGAPTDYEQGAAAPSNIRTKSFYGFAQDEWHVTSRFTWTLGLRYEYNSPKYDTEGRTYSFVEGDQSTRFPNAPPGLVFPNDKGAPEGVNFPVKNNWAPRIGFAWDPAGNGKTSVRGGFGIFYDILKAEDNFQFNGAPPFFSLASFGFPSMLSGNLCGASNQAGMPITYFSDPFDTTCSLNTFPSKPSLSGPAYFNANPTSEVPFGEGLFFVDPHLKTPYTYQYNLSVERELLPNLIFEVNYLGSDSHGLTNLEDINPFVLGTTNRVLNLLPGTSTCLDATAGGIGVGCTYSNLLTFRNANNANYNALTASLTKQMSNSRAGQIYFTFGYTYGHAIDSGTGFRQRNSSVPSYDPNLFRASSDSDIRQRITFSGGWDLPFDHMWESGPKRLTQGWSIFHILTWRTGFPIDVFADLPSITGFTNEGPSGAGEFTSIVHANVAGPLNTLNPRNIQTINGQTGSYWLNPNSFSYAQCGDKNDPFPCTPGPTIFPSDSQVVANPQLATYGTLPRNFLRGPGIINFDMSVAKTTAITERLKLQIRADFFNLFNHAEFANPDTVPQDSTFGQILTTGGPDPTVPGGFSQKPRIIQLAARFTF
jgi:hypothetical protein